MASATVGFQQRTWADPSRVAWQGNPERPLPTCIWYPAGEDAPVEDRFAGPPDRPHFRTGRVAIDATVPRGDRPHPLVVLSHGTGGTAEQLGWLATALAAEGFVAIAPDHHGNTANQTPTARGFLHFWERARDLTAVLDRIATDPVFGPVIDVERVGAAGFSLGGSTVLSLAGATADIAGFVDSALRGPTALTDLVPPEYPDPDEFLREFDRLADHAAAANASYRDDRVQAVYSIAPAIGAAFSADGLATAATPTRIVVGTDDVLAPPGDNADHYAANIAGASLELLARVGHYTFLAEPTEAGRHDLPLFCVDAPTIDRRRVHADIGADAVRFLGQHLGRTTESDEPDR